MLIKPIRSELNSKIIAGTGTTVASMYGALPVIVSNSINSPEFTIVVIDAVCAVKAKNQ
jgi:hypothetical protein